MGISVIEVQTVEGSMFCALLWGPPLSEPKNVTNQQFYKGTFAQKKRFGFQFFVTDTSIFLYIHFKIEGTQEGEKLTSWQGLTTFHQNKVHPHRRQAQEIEFVL